MGWTDLKAAALAGGGCRIEGALPPDGVARSTAGPGAGGAGAVFFSSGGRRVRIPLGTDGPAVMVVRADGSATLSCDGETAEGRVETRRSPLSPAGLRHGLGVVRVRLRRTARSRSARDRGRRVEEIVDLVGAVADSVDAIR